ncbi:sensor histidine kinase [Sphingobacterium sp. UBA5670]|uniref:sensor histidine kinase n=1 Tax=Sphingobacterium sp. UBA5670 TaxID=1947502 RepID=UPI0025E0C5F8|nr:histidine kinase [Sphingobacterium sp. UBA5670]
MKRFAYALENFMYFCGVKFRFKNAEQKNSIILIACLFLLLLIGGGLLGVIHHKVDRLNKRILMDFADENMLLVKKQLELLQQDIYLSEKKILDQFAFDPSKNSDSLLVIVPVGQSDQLGSRMLTLLQTRTVQHRLYHIYIDIEKLNAYFARLNFGRRAYFELYDDKGICVYSPDNRKWGKRKDAEITKQGRIVKSDYLELDVMVNAYPSNILFVGGEIRVYVLLLSIEEEIQELLTYSILLGVGLMLVAMVLIYFNAMERRKIQQLKMQSLKQENEYTQMRLVQLRQQINPHFLFNTFGSLQYLIGKDDDLAKSFIGKMTKVYRKMLRTDENEWSSLGEELELAKAYFFLQQVRFGTALSDMKIDIPATLFAQKIPRLGLQMLVENAIKHTRISTENPLTIEVLFLAEGNVLEIRNNWQPRQGAELEGEGYGLNYLASIYSYYAMSGFRYGIEAGYFSVSLPLS